MNGGAKSRNGGVGGFEKQSRAEQTDKAKQEKAFASQLLVHSSGDEGVYIAASFRVLVKKIGLCAWPTTDQYSPAPHDSRQCTEASTANRSLPSFILLAGCSLHV